MNAIRRKAMVKFCLAMGLFILAGVFRQLDQDIPPLAAAACFMLTNLIYIGLAMAWGFSISNRILHKNVRQYLLLGCAMAVMWMFLRTVKYRFFEDNHVTRYLWYLYYVPQILAPLFSLFAALEVGRREGDAISPKWYLLLIPATLLIGGVLTNDLHQMAFRSVPGAAALQADYTHGWMYYLAMTWIVGLLLATGIIVYRKCHVSESRRYAWVPLCVFLGGFVLCALSFANTYTFHKMPECFCLTFAAFWESCLQVGLMPTNGYYRYFFSESTVAAQIVDGQGRSVYRAQNAPVLTPAQLDAAAREAILLNADTRLQSAPVQDGRVYWVEDTLKYRRGKCHERDCGQHATHAAVGGGCAVACGNGRIPRGAGSAWKDGRYLLALPGRAGGYSADGGQPSSCLHVGKPPEADRVRAQGDAELQICAAV